MEDVFQEIRKRVATELSCSAHNKDHVDRVYNLALRISEGVDVDMDVIRAAALLHDIARVKEDNDPSGKTDHAIVGAEMAKVILEELNFPKSKINHVCDCILSHRKRGDTLPQTLEAKILFDSDKLDIIGAIGIARAFIWAGRNGSRMHYIPKDMNEYAKDNLENGKISGRIKDKTKHSPQIEYETVWKHVGEKLHTEKAKQIAEERSKFVRDFLDRMDREIKGEL